MHVWQHAAMAALIALVCIALYVRTGSFPFQFDDIVYLQNNLLLRDANGVAYLTDFREFLNRPFKLGLDPDLAVNMAMRPVAYLTFYWNYLASGFHPEWYRVVNIVIHMANALMIYALAWLLIGRRESRLFIATTSAMLFALHPLAVESVTYVVQRFTSLCTLFYLLALWLHLRAGNVEQRRLRWLMRAASMVVTLLGMLTKECMFTAPFMAVFLDRFVQGTPLRLALRRALPLLVCLPVIPALLLACSWAQNGGDMSLTKAVHLMNSKDLPYATGDYAITQITVVMDYLRKLCWPSGLNVDPDWPLYRTLWTPPVLLAAGIGVLLLAGAVAGYAWHRSDSRFVCIFAFTVWFFFTISTSSGIAPLPDLMSEHRSYLPSVGFFVVVACLLDLLRVRLQSMRWRFAVVPALVTCWSAALFVTTWQRDEVWRTSISLWEDATTKSPGKIRAWGNLASAYAVAARHEDALRSCDRALELEPRYENAACLRASILNGLNRCREAFETMQRLIHANQQAVKSADVQYNVGLALTGLNDAERGEKILLEVVEHMPTHWRSHVALGLLKFQRGDVSGALKHWQTANAISPGNPPLEGLLKQALAKAPSTSFVDR